MDFDIKSVVREVERIILVVFWVDLVVRKVEFRW